MKKSARLVVFALVFVSLACSPVQNFFTSPGISAPRAAPPETTGSLEAEATSAISVQLAWEPVQGASQYQVEATFSDLEPVVLAVLPGDATTYEDFPAPPDTELTYRVTAETSSGRREVGTAELPSPADVPNPLVVTVMLEENTFEMPTPDPQDPSTWILDSISRPDSIRRTRTIHCWRAQGQSTRKHRTRRRHG